MLQPDDTGESERESMRLTSEKRRGGRKKHQKSIRLLHDIIGFCTRSTSFPYAGAAASHYFVRLLSLILPCYAVCVCVCVCAWRPFKIYLKAFLSLTHREFRSVHRERNQHRAPRNDGENSSAISKRRRRRRRQRPRKANAYWMDRIIRDPCFFFFFLTACAVKILFEADEVYSTQFGQMFHFLVGSSGSFEMKKR
jgi:hypothetical protein